MGDVFLGVVLNPKTLEPCPAYKQPDEDGDILFYPSSLERVEGQGYIDQGGGDDYKQSELSGYPRAHTPRGVRTQGRGYGTVLYTSIALAVHQAVTGAIELGRDADGDGISSNDHRSDEASVWWRRARRLGLAHQVEVEGAREEEREEDVDGEVSSSDLSRSQWARRHRDTIFEALNEFLMDNEGVSLTSFSISYEGTRHTVEMVEATADIYPWTQAQRFVPFTCAEKSRGDDHAWRRHDRLFTEIDIEEMDPALFSTMNIRGTEASLVAFLADVAKRAGMRAEWERVMAFAALGKELPEDTDDLYAVYHPLRSNPTVSRAQQKALEERSAIIEALGLDKFADLD